MTVSGGGMANAGDQQRKRPNLGRSHTRLVLLVLRVLPPLVLPALADGHHVNANEKSFY